MLLSYENLPEQVHLPQVHPDQERRSWGKKRYMGAVINLHSKSGSFPLLCHVAPGKSRPSLKFNAIESKNHPPLLQGCDAMVPGRLTKILVTRNAGLFGQSCTGISCLEQLQCKAKSIDLGAQRSGFLSMTLARFPNHFSFFICTRKRR